VAKPKRKNTETVRHVGAPLGASKTLAYEALAAFNRDVEQVLADLERLGACAWTGFVGLPFIAGRAVP
jgi:hypothetical protein